MQIMFYWCSTSFGQRLMLPVVCSAALLPRLERIKFLISSRWWLLSCVQDTRL